VWQPGAPGGLTAEFKFLPLQFFENTTGKLRFLRADHDLYGVDLDEQFSPGGWLCTSGDGLMVASSIAYLFKVPAGLKAWVSFMEKFGMPPLHATTSAVKDSAEWDSVKAAIEGYGEDLALVTDEGTKINPITMPNGGQAPHAPLVERMDRAISRIWMGGDLATMSATGPSGTGSNPQSDDLAKLQEDDAAMITDTLQHYVDRQVIRMLFGDDVDPLAYFKLSPPARVDVDRERATDEFLVKMGVPVGKKQLMERYGRTEPADADELATAPAPAPSAFGGNPFARAANEAPAATFRRAALKDLSEAQAKTLKPLVDRIEAILALPDDKIDAALAKLKADLVHIRGDILRDPAVADAFEKILGTALVQGAATAREKQTTS
jgi:phage gp29-like protein